MRSNHKKPYLRQEFRDENTLFIEDLDPELTDLDLATIFAPYGHILKISILKLPELMNHAFVCFSNHFEAQNAQKACQYTKLGRYNIRIMIKNEHKNFPPSSRILVENLESTISMKELHGLFEKIGSVAYVCIKESKGTVQFRNADDAKLAIQHFHGDKVKNQIISVSEYCEASKRNLYFKNIPSNMAETELLTLMSLEFSKFGEIESLKVQKDVNTQKYFGFVCFVTLESAQKAYYSLNSMPYYIKGCSEELFLNWVNPQDHKLNVYVKNLVANLTEQEITQAFSKYGRIRRVVLTTFHPKPGRPQYLSGNVVFIFPEGAEKIVKEKKYPSFISELFLDQTPFIAYHETKEERNNQRLPHNPILSQPITSFKKPLKLQCSEFNPNINSMEIAKLAQDNINSETEILYAKETQNSGNLINLGHDDPDEESEKTMELKHDLVKPHDEMYYIQGENTDVITQIRKEKNREFLFDKLIQLLNDNFNDDLALQIKGHFELSEESSVDILENMIEDKETFKTVIGRILFDIYTAKKTKHDVE